MKSIQTILIIFFATLAAFFAWGSFTGGLFGGKAKEVTYHNTVLQKIENLGKLELVKYKFKDVLEHKKEYKWWFDSKAVLIISGEAVGCIDLKKVKPEHIQEKGDTVTIQLPKPELCYYKINHKESRIYNTTTYSFSDQPNLIGKAFKKAESHFRKVALNAGILEQTKKNGEQMLKPMFEQLSGKRVIFTYDREK